jgi:formate dehydrogenase beta subunit
MSGKPTDLTHAPDLAHERRTGPFRTQRPVYVDLLPPCNHACPAGENIQAWLGEAQAGHFEAAWRILVADNPLPAVHGRICYHPCEDSCNRRHLDSAVSIHAVERFLGDLAIEKGWKHVPAHEPSGKRILVVGAGPSGLSAAYHLARLGHAVEIRDAGPLPGGMMHFGIPAYRMPRAVLEAEIRKIEDMGVTMTPSPSARTSRSAPRSRRAMPARCWTRCRFCATLKPARRRSSAASRSTAAATRRWTRPASRGAWARPRR